MKSIPYKYANLPIPGGGYVTGFEYHPTAKDVLYCRTDIGGTYRYDFKADRWVSLIDHVTMFDISETFPTAMALDPKYPNRLYIACGINDPVTRKKGVFAVSDDYGDTFTYHELPCTVHGNWPGRGTGKRLVVDPNNSDIIYFASQRAGLLRSNDRGVTWEYISIADKTRQNETNDTFVWVSPVAVKDGRSQIIVLATAGIDNATEGGTVRGHSMFISTDAGATWNPLPLPEVKHSPDVKMNGIMGHRYDYDGKYLYITLSSTGPCSYLVEEGYSCDSGDACNGKIVRYPVNPDGTLGNFEDITPVGTIYNYSKEGFNECGFGGICSSPQVPGLLAASTLCERRGDMVFISRDYGDTWQVSLYDLEIGNLHFNSSYMKPEFNGGHSLLHWLSDIKINPFDSDDVIFNSGTGVFGTKNFTQDDCSWCDRCTGIEETVHLNVYSPHKGDVIALDIVGDLGGFAFTSLDTPCRNSFDDANGNRYITCINADYSDLNPDFVIATPRGNWTGLTKGGLIVSDNQCKTWTRLDIPYGINEATDERLERITHPNVNSGWVALSPDCQNIVWSVADNLDLPVESVICSNDRGKTFTQSIFYDFDGKQVTEGSVKVFSDRVNSDIMYGFTTSRIIYISKDCGRTFNQYEVPSEVPEYTLSKIDTFDKASVWAESGKSGVFYISMIEQGIWKMIWNSEEDILHFEKLTKDNDIVYKMGLGINENSDFLKGDKAIYAAASIDGVYGFYRSTDQCATWTRINNEKQMFGDINCICGDSREFGRFFIATGSRGLLYGSPLK